MFLELVLLKITGYWWDYWYMYIDGLVQDCSNSIALPMELLKSYTKPSIYYKIFRYFNYFLSPRNRFLFCVWVYNISHEICAQLSGIILRMHPANERWRCIVTSSLIGWAHTQNDPWVLLWFVLFWLKDIKFPCVSMSVNYLYSVVPL